MQVDVPVVVESLADDGSGRSYRSGFELRIPGGTPGDRVRVRIVHRSPHGPTIWCEIEEVLERGPDFVKPGCPHAWPTRGSCGGCPLVHVQTERVNALKQDAIRSALSACVPGITVQFNPAPQRDAYRNRGHFVAGRDRNGELLLGSFAPRSHQVVKMTGCSVLRFPLAERASLLQAMLQALGAPVYPDDAGLRYATLRADGSGRVVLDLVISGGPELWGRNLIPELAAQGGFAGISYSVNSTPGNAMRVGDSVCAHGTPTIVDSLGSVELELAAGTFSQLNSEVASQMYAWAARATHSPSIVWDWYCGVGALGLAVAEASSAPECTVYGADSVAAAIDLAKRNAERAGLQAHFETLDLSNELPKGWPRPDVVLVNPPRRGLDRPVLDALLRLDHAALIYMSCNPKSFARDAMELKAHGWEFGEVQGFDMLPGTAHVELIALSPSRKP